ncbi:cytochrome d ubiquinol oxidase subunit II [Mucilaginibacter sp. RS28]|uniref:Cytochrome d ubiquinol oxidase subunit II n=1 Tax=Mucilaginibacter straminoryzae TaxID=2932774 RepID=A0A9X1X3I7_9SPHI|nr:cytochrome d ubiquinol oxidase subunit II [Mucilaginibacter straminoryzae]MCJ8209615.1 cytochrome d ubiquinol oxidase subunit II [Mucilaginibacter straminoryzae]
MHYVIIIFLWLSILLYLVLGGADFGAGIIELFTPQPHRGRTRKAAYQAIGPIWEANHMWLVIAVVILFVGFPAIYSTMSIYLHIPLVVMLLGITARGTAFVFRNYDAVVDNMQKIYDRIFLYSSFVTPLFLGIIAGSAISGRIDPSATDFLHAYVYSWLNWFSVAIGLFTVSLCSFLASIYLIGEAANPVDAKEFIYKARVWNIVTVGCGAVVFIAAEAEHIPLVKWVFGNTIGLIAVILATLSLILLWVLVARGKTIFPRILAGFQATMILLAVTYVHFPNFIVLKTGNNLSLFRHQAPAASMNTLGWALIIGSVFIIPALFYLYYSFQKDKHREQH